MKRIFACILALACAFALVDAYAFTEEEVELVAGVISAEARGEDFTGQLLIGMIIINRLNSGLWGDSIHSVVYAKNQFASPYRPTPSTMIAARLALSGVNYLPESTLYFRVGSGSWGDCQWLLKWGGHNFYCASATISAGEVKSVMRLYGDENESNPNGIELF